MNIGLLNIMHNKVWDFRPDLAQTYADALKNAIELHLPNDVEKQEGYFLSKKGYQKDGVTHAADFEEKLYVGDIHRIERHLYWNDEELQEDDQIINVVVVDGPVTRDGDGCSYGTKDFRDQVMYANTIPQVVGHLFIINTPGGQASCRNDYEMMIADCREKGKPTVAFVDGMCCSSGVNLACRCDRVIVMNAKDEFGCIGTMAAFWAVAHDTVSQDGYRYVELVGKDCPEKNDWYREAAKGEYEKLQAELDKDTRAFHDEVRQNRPLVTDDMLTGRVFEAQEVIPALVDEIGDMNRAIECVFELADETLTAARLVTAEPKEEPAHEPENKPEESTHQINNDMTEEEKKAQEAEAAAAATQEEAPATEQPAEEAAPATEAPAAQEEEKPAEEEQEPAEEAPAAEEEKPAEEEEKPAEEEKPTEEAIENAQADIGKITETLHNAEQMIAEKDQEIADLKSDMEGKANSIGQLQADLDQARKDIEAANGTIAERDKSIEEKDALIDQQKKQIADLKAEVKELAGKPAPMTDEKSGIPADNGTGEAPKGYQKRITRDMSYEEIRAAKKKAREEAKK
jgi:ClpP class serine protease